MRLFLVVLIIFSIQHVTCDEDTSNWENAYDCRRRIAEKRSEKIGKEEPAINCNNTHDANGNGKKKQKEQHWYEKPIHITPLIGRGYDNLLNQPLNSIYSTSISKCKTTGDGRYLITDQVKSNDVKEFDFDKVARRYNDIDDYFLDITDNINLLHDNSIYGIPKSISGRFDSKFNDAQQRSELGNVIFRTQIRYTAYIFSLSDNSQFSSTFRDKVQEIITQLEANSENKGFKNENNYTLACRAIYLVQQLLRDYGTHYITEAVIGAQISQDDYFKMNTSADNFERDAAIYAREAAANFYQTFSINLVAVDPKTDQYQAQVRSSKISLKGGMETSQLLHPDNFFPDLIAPLDIRGEPLYTLFTEEKIRNLNIQQQHLPKLADLIKSQTIEYYNKNKNIKALVPNRPPYHDSMNMTLLDNVYPGYNCFGEEPSEKSTTQENSSGRGGSGTREYNSSLFFFE